MAQNGAFVGFAGDAVQEVVVVLTVAVPEQSFPLHEPDAVASIFTVRTSFRAVMQPEMSLALM